MTSNFLQTVIRGLFCFITISFYWLSRANTHFSQNWRLLRGDSQIFHNDKVVFKTVRAPFFLLLIIFTMFFGTDLYDSLFMMKYYCNRCRSVLQCTWYAVGLAHERQIREKKGRNLSKVGVLPLMNTIMTANILYFWYFYYRSVYLTSPFCNFFFNHLFLCLFGFLVLKVVSGEVFVGETTWLAGIPSIAHMEFGRLQKRTSWLLFD